MSRCSLVVGAPAAIRSLEASASLASSLRAGLSRATHSGSLTAGVTARCVARGVALQRGLLASFQRCPAHSDWTRVRNPIGDERFASRRRRWQRTVGHCPRAQAASWLHSFAGCLGCVVLRVAGQPSEGDPGSHMARNHRSRTRAARQTKRVYAAQSNVRLARSYLTADEAVKCANELIRSDGFDAAFPYVGRVLGHAAACDPMPIRFAFSDCDILSGSTHDAHALCRSIKTRDDVRYLRLGVCFAAHHVNLTILLHEIAHLVVFCHKYSCECDWRQDIDWDDHSTAFVSAFWRLVRLHSGTVKWLILRLDFLLAGIWSAAVDWQASHRACILSRCP